jgi:small-conductance mechanosensitive channel
MDIHQAINLFIYERFAEEQIEFAYPTQTLYVTSSTNGPDA